MKPHDSRRIPTHDILGRRVKVGEDAIVFNKDGIVYEGTIIQIGGKRWFQIDMFRRFGGIGNHYMIKDEGEERWSILVANVVAAR